MRMMSLLIHTVSWREGGSREGEGRKEGGVYVCDFRFSNTLL